MNVFSLDGFGLFSVIWCNRIFPVIWKRSFRKDMLDGPTGLIFLDIFIKSIRITFVNEIIAWEIPLEID